MAAGGVFHRRPAADGLGSFCFPIPTTPRLMVPAFLSVRDKAISGFLTMLALLVLSGCGDPRSTAASSSSPTNASSLFAVHFTHDWYPEPEHGGFFAAKITGIWSGLGLDVEVSSGGPNSEIEKKVALDPLAIGLLRGDGAIIAAERGLPIIAIQSYFQHDPQGIMVHENDPVRRFEDLDDRDIAMQVGNTWFLYLQKKFGLRKTRVRPVTGSVANFVKDTHWITQAYPTSEPYYALKEGARSRVLQISDSGFDPYRVVIANRVLVEKHPDIVAKFCLGAYRGWQEYYRDPLPVHQHILKISPTMEMEGMKFSYAKLRELRLIEGEPARGEFMGAVAPSRWEATGKILLDLGVIQKLPAWSDVYSTNFIPSRVGATVELPKPVWTVADVKWPK